MSLKLCTEIPRGQCAWQKYLIGSIFFLKEDMTMKGRMKEKKKTNWKFFRIRRVPNRKREKRTSLLNTEEKDKEENL